MNTTPRAAVVELTGANARDSHVDLRGAFGLFPADPLGGPFKSSAGQSMTLLNGRASVGTDIDEGEAMFRERGEIRQFFEAECVSEGGLILIERVKDRVYRLSKASQRAFQYYL